MQVLSLRNNKLDELPTQLLTVAPRIETLIISHVRRFNNHHCYRHHLLGMLPLLLLLLPMFFLPRM